MVRHRVALGRFVQVGTLHCAHLAAAPKDEIAEILVFGQQQAALSLRTRHHIGVARRRCDLGHIDDIVTRAAKVRDEARVDALVGKPAHG